MGWVYNLSVYFYCQGIRFTALFNPKAKAWVRGRKGVFNKIEETLGNPGETVWFHCASLGEFEQGRPVMEKYHHQFPEHRILVTFFSPSGYEIRKDYSLATCVCYLPIDSRGNAVRLLEIAKPRMVFFVKYEFWKHYVKTIKMKGIPLYLISGVFRQDHVFFKLYGGIFRDILDSFSHFFVQDENSKQLLATIGIDNCTVTGDTRFDRVCETAQITREIPIVEHFQGSNRIFIAGSTWPKDEAILTEYINSTDADLKFIIAPHEIKEENIHRIMASLTVKAIRYSEADEAVLDDCKVLIIDNIGMLSSLYKYSYIAYIGGAFGKNVHNILEAAVFGVPVIYGPNYFKFKEAIDLVEKGGAFSISSSNEFKQRMDFILADPYIAKIAGEVSRAFVQGSKGATDKIMQHIGAESKD